jgi:hypothetical protein
MKKNLHKLLIAIAIIIVGSAFAQQVPTGTPNNNQFWKRGGNNPLGNGNIDNIFGTAAGFNSPIYTTTNGINRTRLNGTLTTPINTVNQNVDGYFGISPSGYFATNTPVSMLHLYGPNNTFFGIGGGWRSWMKTGAFMNENSDAMYVGMKPEAGTNRSDAVIGWSVPHLRQKFL